MTVDGVGLLVRVGASLCYIRTPDHVIYLTSTHTYSSISHFFPQLSSLSLTLRRTYSYPLRDTYI